MYSIAGTLYFQTQVRLLDNHIRDSRLDGVSMNSEKTYIVQPVNFPDPVKYMKFKNSGICLTILCHVSARSQSGAIRMTCIIV